MRILGISCSPRKKGNTTTMLTETLKGAESEGAETALFNVAKKVINGCDSCYACTETGRCKIKDDMQGLYDEMIKSDGIVFGAPVYMYGMTAQAKTIMDRTFALNRPDTTMRNKVGGVVAVAGSIGLVDVLKDFYFYFVVKQMVPANFVSAYAVGPGDITQLENGMKAAWNLGRQIVQIAAKKFEYPKEFPSNFFAFGTHTH